MDDDPRELILCRHTVTKAETTFPREALPAWRAVGWLPVDEWPTDPSAEAETPPTEPSPSTSTSRKRSESKE